MLLSIAESQKKKKMQTVDLGKPQRLSWKRKRRNSLGREAGELCGNPEVHSRPPKGCRPGSGRELTIDHGQPGLVQEAHPAVLEEPDGEDGKGEQQDEGEQAHAVLPVAFLRLLLGGELLHGAAVLGRRPRGGGRGPEPQPPTQQHW